MKGKRFNEGKTPLNQIPAGVLKTWLLANRKGSALPGWYLNVLGQIDDLQQGRRKTLEFLVGTLPDDALLGASMVYQYGAEKYDQWNWTHGMKWSTVLGCLFRHMLAEGEDDESHLSHEWHAAANVIMLAFYCQYGKGVNDIVFYPDPEGTL